MRVVDYVIDQVYRAGAKHVFTITGGGAMFLNDAVAAHPLIEPVCNHHEQASAMAAVAYSKYTGKPSLVCPTTGCGGTNTITGLLDAWQDSVPVVFVSGNVNLHQISPPGVRNLGVQEARIVDIVKPITKYAKLIESVDEVEETVTEALRLCTEGRPGPVWIDIPMDIQGKEMEVFDFEKEILKAKRPLILAGGGVSASMSRDDFRDFVAGMRIPVVTTFNAVDLITDDDLYFVGRVGVKGTRAGNFAMQNCDFLLVLGSRLAVPATGYNYKTFAREAKVVVVDIDRKEHSKDTVKIDYFIESDVKDFVKKVGYPSVAFWHQQLDYNDEWQQKCVEWKKKWPVIQPYRSDEDGIDLYDFMGRLNKYKPDGSVVISDAGSAYYVGCQATEIKGNDRFITSSAQAEMGFTVPACIGAAFAGAECVVGITGDGSLQMNIQELQTIAHHQLPIKLFVWNNEGYLSIRTTQKKFFEGREIGTDDESGVSFPHLYDVTNAYGLDYLGVHNYATLDSAMDVIFNTDGPMVIEIMCQKWQEVVPTLQGRKNPDGTISAPPLEDMYPFLPREEFYDNMIVEPVE